MSRSVLAMVVATLGLGLFLLFGHFPRSAAGPGDSAPEPWVYEETVFHSETYLSRPELCIVNDRAYVAFRRTVPGARPRVPDTQIVLKAFDIAADGSWTDRTRELFGEELYVLYGSDDPHNIGEFRDHQLICADDAFWLAFSAGFQENGQEWVHIVVRRYDPQWNLQRQTTVLATPQGPGVQLYKSDDPGAALLNDVLYVWVVKLSNGLGTPATGFALYGLDPVTLEITVDDGADGPLIIENPLQAPFAGVMDFIDDEYRLFTNPRDVTGSPFDQDGLVEYHCDANWNFLGQTVIEHPFGARRPAYATGRSRYGPEGQFEVWGFTVTDPESGQERGAIGEAWLRLSGPDGDTYLLVSDSDNTRHTEIAIYNNWAYVAYFHVVEPRAVTIRRYAIPTASVGAPPPTSPAALRTYVHPPPREDPTPAQHRRGGRSDRRRAGRAAPGHDRPLSGSGERGRRGHGPPQRSGDLALCPLSRSCPHRHPAHPRERATEPPASHRRYDGRRVHELPGRVVALVVR